MGFGPVALRIKCWTFYGKLDESWWRLGSGRGHSGLLRCSGARTPSRFLGPEGTRWSVTTGDRKWLKVGVMEKGNVVHSDRGSQQGGTSSPILANLYLHEVLDKWFELKKWSNPGSKVRRS